MGTPPPHATTPTYEGRALPRPDEELVDQGLRFDVDTLLSRRRMLAFLGIGTATLGLAACGGGSSASTAAASSSSAAAGTGTEIPDETAGLSLRIFRTEVGAGPVQAEVLPAGEAPPPR